MDKRGQIRKSADGQINHWHSILNRWADRVFRSGGHLHKRRLNRYLVLEEARIRRVDQNSDLSYRVLRVSVGTPRRIRVFDILCEYDLQRIGAEEAKARRTIRCCARALALYEAVAARRGVVFYGSDGRITEPKKRKNMEQHFTA